MMPPRAVFRHVRTPNTQLELLYAQQLVQVAQIQVLMTILLHVYVIRTIISHQMDQVPASVKTSINNQAIRARARLMKMCLSMVCVRPQQQRPARLLRTVTVSTAALPSSVDQLTQDARMQIMITMVNASVRTATASRAMAVASVTPEELAVM